MKKENWFKVMRVLGVVIMLLAFPMIPEEYPRYYQILFFNTGLVLVLAIKWSKFKQEIGIDNNKNL